jgi:hypothetical protein
MDTRWPIGLRAGAGVMALLLPIFGLSVILVTIGDLTLRRFATAVSAV